MLNEDNEPTDHTMSSWINVVNGSILLLLLLLNSRGRGQIAEAEAEDKPSRPTGASTPLKHGRSLRP